MLREKEKLLGGALNPHLREVIDSIAEEFRKVIEEDTYAYYMKVVENFRKDFSGDRASEGQYRAKYYNERRHIWMDEDLKGPGLIQRERNGEVQLKPDIEPYVRQQAIKNSYEIIKSFQAKMYIKLSGFLSELGKDFDVDYTGKLRINDIHFKFVDGSRFSIRNQIVSHFRYPGGHYYSYPTTFHNAYLANNNKIVQPSEYTIKKAFLGK